MAKTKAVKPKPKVKAPTLFEATADRVLAGLAENKSLRAVCKGEGMPSCQRVLAWLEDPEKADFAEQYTRTRARAYEQMADEIIEISDSGENDTYIDDNGMAKTDTDVIARSKLRVDSRKWLLSKMLPKVFGDKLDLKHSGGVSVVPVTPTDEAL